MASFTEILTRFVRPFLFPLSIFVILVIFIVVGNWIAKKYYPQTRSSLPFTDIANNPETPKEASVTLYHATWCPACKRAKPEWEAFVKEHSGNSVNGYKIVTNEVDCSNNDDPRIAALIQEHKINGFPTVQMYVDGNTVHFDSPVTKSTLDLFVNKML
jgi:thiol-disulfide isomerase/thioredoxin